MAVCIILAGGGSTRMPGDKAFMEIGGRRVIDIQLDVLDGLFERFLVVGNAERMESLKIYQRPGVSVLEETFRGSGPLGGILSGLCLSGSEENFVLACDMPFIRRDAVLHVMRSLDGYQAAVPVTPGGLEPLHAAYRRDCAPVIKRRLQRGELKVTGFYEEVSVNYLPFEELARFDSTGRFLLNINSPEEMRKAVESKWRAPSSYPGSPAGTG